MLTNAIEVMGYIKASAGRSNLGVVFENTNHPRHDGNTIYLPRITSTTTQEEMIEIRTLLYRLCDVPEKGRNKI